MFITNIRLQDWLGKALQEIAQSENKSLAKTITDILTTAVMSTHVDEYIESLMYNETTRFLLIRSGNRFAFVLDDGHFPTKNDLVPTVNIDLDFEKILWSPTLEGAKNAAAKTFDALEQKGWLDIPVVREGFGL